MSDKSGLIAWVQHALRESGGRATLLEVARHIWANHESELRLSGDLFYTWQYDYRWAATKLRMDGKMKAAKASPNGVWELTEAGRH